MRTDGGVSYNFFGVHPLGNRERESSTGEHIFEETWVKRAFGIAPNSRAPRCAY